MRKQENDDIDILTNPQNGHTVTDSIEMETILNDYFKSVFTTDDNSTIPDKGPSLHPSLPTFEITEHGIYNILTNCDPSKSSGL